MYWYFMWQGTYNSEAFFGRLDIKTKLICEIFTNLISVRGTCAYLVCGTIQFPQACPGVADLTPLLPPPPCC